MTALAEHRAVSSELIRVTISLEPCDWHSHGSETVWAVPSVDNQFILRNIPFFACGLSYDDTVKAVEDSEGVWQFARVARRGGHSTYRLFVTNASVLCRFQEFWVPLSQLGCTLERATERLFAIDVPPNADIHRAYELLQAGEEAGIWDFEEAHLGHVLHH